MKDDGKPQGKTPFWRRRFSSYNNIKTYFKETVFENLNWT